MNADGSVEDDFVITGQGRLVHLCNAPSPGATSSLAIAEHLVATALERVRRGRPRVETNEYGHAHRKNSPRR